MFEREGERLGVGLGTVKNPNKLNSKNKNRNETKHKNIKSTVKCYAYNSKYSTAYNLFRNNQPQIDFELWQIVSQD